MASWTMDKRTRDPQKKQRPEDVARMLLSMLGCLAEGGSTHGLLRHDGINTDFTSYNENEEHGEIVLFLFRGC